MNIYKDIETRTNGEIYIGVVGPVRTGKSTFIKRFMELMVLPAIADDNNRKRAMDELPQSAAGKTVMTTEPKFIPKEAVEVLFEDGVHRISDYNRYHHVYCQIHGTGRRGTRGGRQGTACEDTVV